MGDACSPEILAEALLPSMELSEGRMHTPQGVHKALLQRWAEDNRLWVEFEQGRFNLQYGDVKRRSNYELFKEGIKAQGGKEPSKVENLIKIIRPAYQQAPTEAFPDKFMNPIAKKMRAFNRKHHGKPVAEYRKAWKEEITPLMEMLQIDLMRTAQLPAKQQAKLLKEQYDLKPNQVNHVMETVDWWAKAGPTMLPEPPKSDVGKGVVAFINNVSDSQRRWNLPWIMYNVDDAIRITAGAAFKSPTGGVLPAVKAILKTVAGNPFKANPNLKGVESGDPLRDGQAGEWWEPFHLSTVAQKNYAYHLDKELGGDGMGLLSSNVLEYENWNTPSFFRNHTQMESKIFGLGRFMLAEANYNLRLVRRTFGFEGAAKMPQAAGELLTRAVLKSAMFGIPSVIPAEVMWVLKDNMEEKEYNDLIKTMESIPNTNYVGKGLQAGMDVLFGENVVKIDTGKAFGTGILPIPLLGLALRSSTAQLEGVGKNAMNTVAKLSQGEWGQAGIHSTALALTMMSVIGIGPAPARSQQVVKMITAIGESLGDDVNEKQKAVTLTKALLGEKLVKKGEDSRRRKPRQTRKPRMGRAGRLSDDALAGDVLVYNWDSF